MIQGAEGEGDPPPDDKGKGSGTDADKSGGTDTSKKSDDGKSDKTFTQDEVNALIARETDKAKRGRLDPSELGFQSKKELEEFIEQQKTTLESQKSEQEKALEEAKKQAAKEATETVLSTANQRLLLAEFKLMCMKHEVQYPDDAFEIAQKLELWKDVGIDDKGVVKGLDETFFDEFKKQKPYLFAKATGTRDIGAGASGGDSSDAAKQAELLRNYPQLRGKVPIPKQ
jgi:hypothetical protein